MTKRIHGYFPESLIASTENVDDTVLKESVRLKDVRFVFFPVLINFKQRTSRRQQTFASVKTTYITAVSNLKMVIHFNFLHCTLMLVTLKSLPQVLFAKHRYCPLSALVTLVILKNLSSMTSVLPTFDQTTNGAGNPIAMQFNDTLVPSLIVLLSTWFTDARTTKRMYIVS